MGSFDAVHGHLRVHVPPQRRSPFSRPTELAFPRAAGADMRRATSELIDSIERFRRIEAQLRALVNANSVIVGEVRLVPTLQRVAEATRALFAAAYSAAGLLGDGPEFAAFADSGMLQDHGLDVIERPTAIPLPGPTRDPSVAGYSQTPAGMAGVLATSAPSPQTGVRLANLYVARDRPFDLTDEYLLATFAATAGTVIDTALRHDEAARRG